MCKLRVISWKIALKGSIEQKINYLQSVINETHGITIVALQEVTEKDRDYISNKRIFSSFALSLAFRQSDHLIR